MPITVKHGEDFSALAALALLAGAGQQRAPQLPQMPGIPTTAIPGGGGGGRITRGTAGPQVGKIKYGPSEQEMLRMRAKEALRLQQFQAPLELEQQRQEAQIAAEAAAGEWEQVYSAKDKARIARNNNAIAQLQADPRFSAEEKETGERALILDSYGIKKGLKPKEKSPFPEGQDVGMSWTDENGNIHTREPDGTDKVQVTFDKTPKGIQQKHQQDMELETLKNQVKLENERRKQEIKWATEDAVPVVEPAVKGGFLGMGAEEGGPTGEKRLRTPEEVRELSERFFGPKPGEAAGPQGIPQLTEQPSGPPRELIGWSRGMNVKRTQAEADLPEFVGLAQAFLRAVKNKKEKGEKIDPNMARAIQEAIAIGEEYSRRGGL